MGELSAEMMMEEVFIAMDTGRCPRCGVVLLPEVGIDEWKLSCPGCKTVWGGCL